MPGNPSGLPHMPATVRPERMQTALDLVRVVGAVVGLQTKPCAPVKNGSSRYGDEEWGHDMDFDQTALRHALSVAPWAPWEFEVFVRTDDGTVEHYWPVAKASCSVRNTSEVPSTMTQSPSGSGTPVEVICI